MHGKKAVFPWILWRQMVRLQVLEDIREGTLFIFISLAEICFPRGAAPGDEGD